MADRSTEVMAGGTAFTSTARYRVAGNLTATAFVDARFGRFVTDIGTGASPVTRDQLSVPVSPVTNPDDTTLFESPGDPNQKLYLPRYRIVDRPPLQLSLAQGGMDWTLTAELEKFPAPEIGAGAQGAGELPHSVSIVVRYNLLMGDAVAGVKELSLDEITIEQAGVKAVLRGQQTTLRDQLFLAMTDPKYAPVLVVKRVANVAVPVPSSTGITVSSGQATLRGTRLFSFDSGIETNANADVWWDQMTDVQRQLVPQGNARIVNLGAVDFDSLDLTALQAYSYGATPIPGSADASNQLTAGDIFAVQTSAGNYAKVQVVSYGYDLVLRWVTLAPPPRFRPLLLYQVQNAGSVSEIAQNAQPQGPNPGPAASTFAPAGHVDLSPWVESSVRRNQQIRNEGELFIQGDQTIGNKYMFPPGVIHPAPPPTFQVTVFSDEERLAPDPFVFSTASYVFVNLGQVGSNFGLERNDLDYNGHSHSYYRDLSEPWIFYFLPDQFKLGRRDQAPHAPAMSIAVQATDDTLEHTTVTLTYLALPYIDWSRIAAAGTALAPTLTVSSLPPGITGPVLQALQTDQQSITYSLSLPTTGGGGFQVRDKALVDLRAGIGDTISASLADFQSIFGALFTDTELFRGVVEVRLGTGGIHTEHIELVGRISDMTGAAPVDITQAADDVAGTVKVTLANSIESPVEIDALTASLVRDGSRSAATIQGIDLTAPIRLGAGASTSFTVSPSAPVPGSGQLTAALDLSGLKVLPDSQAVWNSILDPHTPNEYQHVITLEVYQSAFNPPADNPQDQVQAVQVDFTQDGSVEVTPAQLPAPAAGPNPPEPLLAMPVALHLPIGDYVLNSPQFGQFQYRVTHVRTSGSVAGDVITVSHSDIARVQ